MVETTHNNQNIKKEGEEFIIDEREYISVFKMFERGTPGEIHISSVFDLINKFDSAGKETAAAVQPSS